MPTSVAIEHLHPTGLLRFDGLSQVVTSQGGKTAYIAGQSAFDAQFQLQGGEDLGAQVQAALRNLGTAVHAAGGQPAHIVSSTVFIKDLTPQKSALFFTALADMPPPQQVPAHAITVVGVTALSGGPAQLVEISAIATVPT